MPGFLGQRGAGPAARPILPGATRSSSAAGKAVLGREKSVDPRFAEILAIARQRQLTGGDADAVRKNIVVGRSCRAKDW